MTDRHLFKVKVSDTPISAAERKAHASRIARTLGITQAAAARYMTTYTTLEKNMYSASDDQIEILYRDGSAKDIAEASDMFNHSMLSKKVKKHYFCHYP